MKYESTNDLVNYGQWSKCKCGDANCPTVWKECVHGLVSIIPSEKAFGGFTVKGQGGRDKVQLIPCGTLMGATVAAEDLSREYGGWL